MCLGSYPGRKDVQNYYIQFCLLTTMINYQFFSLGEKCVKNAKIQLGCLGTSSMIHVQILVKVIIPTMNLFSLSGGNIRVSEGPPCPSKSCSNLESFCRGPSPGLTTGRSPVSGNKTNTEHFKRAFLS